MMAGSATIALTPNTCSSTLEHMFAQITLHRLAAAVAAAICVLAVFLAFAAPSPGAAQPGHYRVKAGDTLWSIASARYSGDPRAAIDHIRSANHLSDDTIHVGDRLVLP
jgi:nucleoid-associated protein YgaU